MKSEWGRLVLQQCCGSGSARIRIHFGRSDPGGPKWPTKVFSSARCSLLGDEDLSCSLDVLIFDQKNINVFSAVNFPKYLVIKTLDLDPDPHWQNAGFESWSALKPMRIHNTVSKNYRMPYFSRGWSQVSEAAAGGGHAELCPHQSHRVHHHPRDVR